MGEVQPVGRHRVDQRVADAGAGGRKADRHGRVIQVNSEIDVEWTVLTGRYDQRSVDVLTRSRFDGAA